MKSKSKRVLLVDDQTTTSKWLVELLKRSGYFVDQAVTEKEASQRLQEVAAGSRYYGLAIVDVMVPTYPLEELIELPDSVLKEAKDSGIRICRLARKVLRIGEDELPIIAISARADQELRDSLAELKIPFFNRASDESDFRIFLRTYLLEEEA